MVAVVAPSSPFDPDALEKGLQRLRMAGLEPRHDPGIFAKHRYLAGDDARRLSELQRAIDDPAVRAIWMARGGYGLMRLLGRLDLGRLAQDPKILVGFSDATALHAAFGLAGVTSVHGPMVARLPLEPPRSQERVLAMLTSAEPPAALEGGRSIAAGAAEGRLRGGNLAMLGQLVGTPFMPDFHGAILVLEDVGERPYKLDRLWTHLSLAGALEGVAGVVLGQLTDCEEPGADYTASAVLEELIAALGVPAVAGLTFGHGGENLALPLGTRARIGAGRIEFLEAAVSDARVTGAAA